MGNISYEMMGLDRQRENLVYTAVLAYPSNHQYGEQRAILVKCLLFR